MSNKKLKIVVALLACILLFCACGDSTVQDAGSEMAAETVAPIPAPNVAEIMEQASILYFSTLTDVDVSQTVEIDNNGYQLQYYKVTDPEVKSWGDFRAKRESVFTHDTFDSLFQFQYTEYENGLYFAPTQEGNGWNVKTYITYDKTNDTEYHLTFDLFELSFDPPARVDFLPENITGKLLYQDGHWKLQLDSTDFFKLMTDYVIVETNEQRNELDTLRSNYTITEAMELQAKREQEAKEHEMAINAERFDETHWMMQYGQTNGTAFQAIFHKDGTFDVSHLGSEYSYGGTYRYDGEALYIHRYDFSAESFSGEEIKYTWDGEAFVSEYEYEMMVGFDHFRIWKNEVN